MALRVGYVARETGTNLVRNISITLATVLTVAVSLSLFGTSLMVRKGVENATARWQGGIEFIVFVKPDATPEQVKAIGEDLQNNPQVANVTFVDKNAAYEEFKELFRDSPEMIESVTPDILPPSYRVEPKDKSADIVRALSDLYKTKPGVKQVVSAQDTIRFIQELSSRLTNRLLVIAGSLLVAAGLLILNTIRMAMFARRREIEVQKLVGATNSFIRIPFMTEGLVQGIIGAAIAIGSLVFLIRPFLEDLVPSDTQSPLFSGFALSGPEVLGTCLLVGAIGIVVGAVGAGIAVTRFLDV